MNNKLQELTDKLYNEGLSKGQKEAGEIIKNALEEANQIVKEAHQKAKSHIDDAQKKADELISNAEAEIRLAVRQAQNEMKLAIENLIITRSLTPVIKDAFSDKEFIQSLIKIMAEKFNFTQDSGFQISITIPQEKQQELVAFVQQKIQQEMNKGIEIKTDKRLKSGFKIGLKGEGYYVSLTDEDFDNLFRAYLRPKTLELLFENK